MAQKELAKAYNPTEAEERIYKLWEESGFFNPDNLPDAKKREPFTIIMPPPNANAPLHVGHALFLTIEDILIRFNRMQGRRALWLPGSDHAGFETQVVFEKKLEKEGRSRFKMERKELYKEIWDFVQNNKHISEQGIKRMGSSCDWSRNTFTLDPAIIEIVYETFEQMYKDGLVYRGQRISNWCIKHQTSLSDLETKYEERSEPLYYLKYGPFTIATARPETKFGDKYVVMHPEDKRYTQYKHGDKIEVEWINGKITATIIKDEAIDQEFGTGVMTITPWHDPIDFEIAQRHGLDKEQIIDKLGRLLPVAGEFQDMKIKEARPLIVEKLKTKSLLEKVDEDYKHNVQLCYKCNSVIEPQIIPQWFVAMTKSLKDGRPSLRDMALQATENNEVKIIPERFEKVYTHWMQNLRDWAISRQIAWGIPFPVWYCNVERANMPRIHFADFTVEQVLNGKTKTYRLKNKGHNISDKVRLVNKTTQEVFGYATITNVEIKKIKDIDLSDKAHYSTYKNLDELLVAFKRHYPPDQKIDGETESYIYDYAFEALSPENTKDGCGQIIISGEAPKKCPVCKNKNLTQDPDTFDTWFSSGQWPYATLMAQGKKDFETYYPTQVMETGWDILFFWVARMIMFGIYKTGQKPFSTVFLHGIVRDKDRQKMSKSKGNVVDPLGVIDTYGTDALRFALIFSTSAGTDIPLSEDKVKGMKHFANKVWNIARFVLTNLEKSKNKKQKTKLQPKTENDKKILEQLEQTIKEVTNNLENFRLHEAAQSIYQFTWRDFADVYIEASKKQLSNSMELDSGKSSAAKTSAELRENTQRILLYCLHNILKLLHPFMPFVTEEIWQQMENEQLLMVETWPRLR